MKTQTGFVRVKPDGSIRQENNWLHIGVDKHETLRGCPAGDTMEIAIVLYGISVVSKYKELCDKAQKFENLQAEIEKRAAKLYAAREGEGQ